MRLKLNISTCPNDTFMFYGLLHGKVDTFGHSFELNMMDIDELNRAAQEQYADISKISCAIYPDIMESYTMLKSGSAIGYGNGPVFVSKKKIYLDEIPHISVAVPGYKTTAALLLERVVGRPATMKSYLFSDIAQVVESGEMDAGVLIHEGRFTFDKLGLSAIADLGALWEEKYSLPVPLGAIVGKKSLDKQVLKDVSNSIAASIEYGFANRQECYHFIQEHAKEMDIDVINKHIDTFVNNFSIDMGEVGKNAVERLTGVKI